MKVCPAQGSYTVAKKKVHGTSPWEGVYTYMFVSKCLLEEGGQECISTCL